MKRAAFAVVALLLTLVQTSAFAQVAAVPPLLNFQGRLAKPDATPVSDGTYSVKFSLFSALTGGTLKWTETINPVHVHNGVFAVLLGKTTPLTDSLFAGNLWLEIKLGSDPALTPRQPLVSVAYALKADTVPDGSIGASQLANGAVTSGKLASGILNPLVWLLGGNSGTNGSSFLGTKDNQPLEFHVNNHRAMRYSYAQNTATAGQEYRGINMLGGANVNSIAAGVVGATIAGGGQDFFTLTDYPNKVTKDFGAIGGGIRNTVSGYAGTIGGGDLNTVSLDDSTVAGGLDNTANNFFTTVGGGVSNTASSLAATVAGGYSNTASGSYATVPGGLSNIAAGVASFAAGLGAHALHDGAFVWADSSVLGSSFNSTAANQFLIQAAGGVGIGTASPQQSLSLTHGMNLDQAETNNGSLDLFFGSASGEGLGSKRTAGGNQWGIDFYTAFQNRMSIANNGFVGVGTTAPQTALHVKGLGGAFNLEGIEGSDHVYMQFFPRGYAAGRKAYFGFPSQGSHDLVIANEDGGAVEVIGNFVNNSDARWKTNVSPLANALESVLNLRGVSYDWRQDIPGKRFAEGRQIGFLAQEVEGVLPELVHTGRDGYKSVAYVNLVPVLVEAVKQQQQQMQTRDRKIADLEEKNEALGTRLAAIEAVLAELKAQRK